MQNLGPGVWWISEALVANAYLVRSGDRTVLIDPGTSPVLNRVARTLHAAGIPPRSVTDIVLTHYDVDHAQSAAEWQRRTGARAWIGALDAAILTGASPVPNTAFRRFMAAVSPLPKLPRNVVLLDQETELLPGFVALPAPGHTPGHFAFTYAGFAFIGDAASVDARGRLEPGPAFLMSDIPQADHTRFDLSSLDADWFCAGHTRPAKRS